MLIAGIDLESTGLDHQQDHLTEVAWVIKEHGSEKPLVMRSMFVLPPPELYDNKEYLKPAIQQLTKIEMRHIKTGVAASFVLESLLSDLSLHDVQCIVGHNSENFDKPFLQAKAEALQFPGKHELFNGRLWVDSSVDVVYPEHCRQTNLLYLCAYHGFLNPFPHAALFDVASMLKVLDRYELAPVLERAKSPWIFVAADVGYENRHLAKARRYCWENFGTKVFPKTWVKRIKEMDLEKEIAEAPFKVVKL